MNLRFLLDTNILSEPLRPKPDEQVLQRLQAHQDEIAVASVVWHELLFGCYRLPESAKRKAIETYLFEVVAPSFPVLPYDSRAAEWHAKERARLTSLGMTPPFADGQIAASASVNDLALVTANSTDYESFQDLHVVSWHS